MNTPQMLTIVIRSVIFMKQDGTNTVLPRSCLSSGHSETSSDAFEKNKEEKGNNIYCVSLY